MFAEAASIRTNSATGPLSPQEHHVNEYPCLASTVLCCIRAAKRLNDFLTLIHVLSTGGSRGDESVAPEADHEDGRAALRDGAGRDERTDDVRVGL